MRPDVPRHVGARGDEVGEDAALHARDISHDRLGEGRQFGCHDPRRDIRRDGDDHELGRVAVGFGATCAEVDRDRDVRGRGIGEDHVDAAGAQAQRHARAEQARADDAHRTDES
ncbi:hypothetical protein GCM10025870_04460 [Agromyces marinus]|uniref:Uncharacterized protein n=1 Tax=Agromyces marinus TaxID=1389020 RepID=A0ABN6YBJ6_9MICO|nr:hypothetical protein GCM10025870_04460 [Agromyces marinus]